MSRGLLLNHEYIAAHLIDFINADVSVFEIFEEGDLEKILVIANLTSDDLTPLLEQCFSIKPNSNLCSFAI